MSAWHRSGSGSPQTKSLIALSGGIAAFAATTLAALLLMRSPAPSYGEGGTFENDCCGTMTLFGGNLSVNGSQKVRYDVGRDADGPYIRPRTYVGVVEDQGFEIDGTQRPRKLRLDCLPQPQTIKVPIGTRAFAFKKKVVRAQQP